MEVASNNGLSDVSSEMHTPHESEHLQIFEVSVNPRECLPNLFINTFFHYSKNFAKVSRRRKVIE